MARLQRTFPRAVAIILATVALQSTVALCLNYLDVHSSSHDSSAKTLAYAEYLVRHASGYGYGRPWLLSPLVCV